jgi:anion-transporting  ArsA/GET3 family ATPase
MTNGTETNVYYDDLTSAWDAYLKQIEWLEQDTDQIMQQLVADAHRLLLQIQQSRNSVYADPIKTEESWKRLRQLDQWTETLLQQLQQNQSRCLTHVQQQRTSLYTELRISCEARWLTNTLFGS